MLSIALLGVLAPFQQPESRSQTEQPPRQVHVFQLSAAQPEHEWRAEVPGPQSTFFVRVTPIARRMYLLSSDGQQLESTSDEGGLRFTRSATESVRFRCDAIEDGETVHAVIVRADESEASLAAAKQAIKAFQAAAPDRKLLIDRMREACTEFLRGGYLVHSFATVDALVEMHRRVDRQGLPTAEIAEYLPAWIEFVGLVYPAHSERLGSLRADLAMALRRSEPKTAMELLEQTRAALDEAPNRLNLELRAHVRMLIASHLDVAGKHVEMAAVIDEAFRLLDGHVNADNRTLMMVEMGRAAVADFAGDTGKARELYERLIARRTAVLGAEHSDVLAARRDLARLLSKFDLDGAIAEMRAVLNLTRRHLASNPEVLAQRLTDLEDLIEIGGIDDESRLLRREAVELLLPLSNIDPLQLGRSRHNYARVLLQLTDYSGAVTEASATLAAIEGLRVSPERVIERAELMASLKLIRARCLLEQDAWKECAEICESLWREPIESQIGKVTQAHACLLRIRLHQLFEEHVSAQSLIADCLRAVELPRGTEISLRIAHWEVSTRLGDATGVAAAAERLRQLGVIPPVDWTDTSAVTSHATTVVAQLDSHIAELLRRERENGPRRLANFAQQACRFSESVLVKFDAVRSHAPEQVNALQRRLFTLVETVRSARMESSGILRLRPPSKDPLRSEFDTLWARVEAETARVSNAAEDLEQDSARIALEKAHEELARFQKERGLPGPAPATLERTAAKLQPDEAAVGYWRYFKPLAQAGGHESHVVWSHFVAFVVFADGDLQLVDLGRCDPVEEALRSYLRRGREGQDQSAAVTLRRTLLDPVRKSFGKRRVAKLWVAADEEVALVPLAALPMDEGGTVGDELRISFVPSLRFSGAQPAAPSRAASAPILATLADVDYDRAPVEAAAPQRGVDSRPHLPNSQPEAQGIEAAFRSAWPESKVLALRGSGADKSALIEALGSARFVHLATHGWFAPGSPDQPSKSIAALGDGPHRLDYRSRLAPLSLCGLALSGANLATQRGAHNRQITAEELAALDLSHVELLVLSACRTSLGIYDAKNGVASFQTALMRAGVQHCITSLWEVPDDATKTLMIRLYDEWWRRGRSLEEALHEAQRAMRSERGPDAKPRYQTRDWAGFVLCSRVD